MARWELICEFKCSKDNRVELDVYNNQGVLSLESTVGDDESEVYLSAEDEEKLRVLLNKRKESK